MASGLLVTKYCEHCRGSQTHNEDKDTYKRETSSKLFISDWALFLLHKNSKPESNDEEWNFDGC